MLMMIQQLVGERLEAMNDATEMKPSAWSISVAYLKLACH